MPFQKGERLPRQGGKENGSKGGRPTKSQQELKRFTAEIAKKYLEERLEPVLDAYISLASGQRSGDVKYKLDPATCRHFVERFVSPAIKPINASRDKSIEDFY